jgi:hypothetical protein
MKNVLLSFMVALVVSTPAWSKPSEYDWIVGIGNTILGEGDLSASFSDRTLKMSGIMDYSEIKTLVRIPADGVAILPGGYMADNIINPSLSQVPGKGVAFALKDPFDPNALGELRMIGNHLVYLHFKAGQVIPSFVSLYLTPEPSQATSSSFPSAPGPTALSSAVPEPAAWTIMLVGFGVLGVALRRRSAKEVLTGT